MSAAVTRVHPGPGQVSAWDFPSPGRLAVEMRTVRIYLSGFPIVQSKKALKLLTRGHAPYLFIPGQDFKNCELRRLKHTFEDEAKGTATEFTLIAGGKIAHRSVWTHFNPLGQYRRLLGYYAVHPGRVERCMLDDVMVEPQPGGYPGWVTPDVVGPFVGDPALSRPPASG